MKLFDQDGKLDEDVQDALYELGNVGVGMASITIGRILGVRVELAAPNVVPVAEVSDQTLLANVGQDQAGIWMRFAKPMNGAVLFILDRSFVNHVVEKMTGRRKEGNELYTDEIAFTSVTEFANMLSAAYMKAVGKYTGMRIFVSPYLFVMDQQQISLGDMQQAPDPVAGQAVWVETQFQLLDEGGGQTHAVGRVVMLPDDDTVGMLMEALGL